MDTAQAAALLSFMKNRLDITWEDEKEDQKLTGHMQRGMSYINRIAGSDLKYINEETPACGLEMELLIAYVMYDRANNLKDFAINYQHDITSLQLDMMAREGNYETDSL